MLEVGFSIAVEHANVNDAVRRRIAREIRERTLKTGMKSLIFAYFRVFRGHILDPISIRQPMPSSCQNFAASRPLSHRQISHASSLPELWPASLRR